MLRKVLHLRTGALSLWLWFFVGPVRPASVVRFWSTLILAACFIEGDGNVDTLDYRDRLRRWCFG